MAQDEIFFVVVTRTATGENIAFRLHINEHQVAEMTALTDEERAITAQHGRQIRALRPGLDDDLYNAILREAFELILASAQRANPSITREQLQKQITPRRVGPVLEKLMQLPPGGEK